jgi:hypothetical protein
MSPAGSSDRVEAFAAASKTMDQFNRPFSTRPKDTLVIIAADFE